MRAIDRRTFSKKHEKELNPLIRRAAKAAAELRHAKDLHRFGPPDFRGDVTDRFKPLLIQLFEAKCAYCESLVALTGAADIELFRPKSHYWWLAYDWNNILLACATCNRYKGTRFPVIGKQAKKPGDEAKERPLLLDPTVDAPGEHLTFQEKDDAVLAVGLTERGRRTIVVVGLNRESLARDRYGKWFALRGTLVGLTTLPRTQADRSGFLALARKMLADSAEHAASLRHLAHQWLDHQKTPLPEIRALLKETKTTTEKERANAEQKMAALQQDLGAYSVETAASSSESLRKFESAAKRIERIEVHNLRAIPGLDFVMPAGETESWLMALGENGLGKSSLLQGIALALMGQKRANERGLNAAQFVRRGARDKRGFVRIHLSSIGPVELRFELGSKKFTVEPHDPKVPLLAYGATRLLPRETNKHALEDRNIRVENLFDPTVPLCDVGDWLVRLNTEDPKLFKSVGRAICRLLMLKDNPAPRITDGVLKLRTPDGWRSLWELSDGYQSMIALVVDIAIGASGTLRAPEDAEGIVILDEIEMHLHPRWKISIVDRFRKVFPKLSFVVTTHDPLCLKGLKQGEILILRRDERGHVTYSVDVPSVDELKADDILSSDLFELSSARTSMSAVNIARYSALLNKPARSPREDAELTKLGDGIGTAMAGALTPMQKDVERALTGVMKQLRNGKRGEKLTHDVVAEIRRQASRVGAAS